MKSTKLLSILVLLIILLLGMAVGYLAGSKSIINSAYCQTLNTIASILAFVALLAVVIIFYIQKIDDAKREYRKKVAVLKAENEKLEKLLHRPVSLTKSVLDTYERGKNLIEKAKKRLVVVQKTPIIFFEDYKDVESGKDITIKKQFYDVLMTWIKGALCSRERSFMLIYSKEATCDKLENSNIYDRTTLEKRMTQYNKHSSKYPGIKLVALSKQDGHLFPSLFGIGDDDVIFWLGNRGEKELCIHLINQRDLADSLTREYEDIYYSKT